ncbi:hypothetical protein [Amycolatopsis rubida]|nr:hypothetical protein [Amycolatopsis rubida]
MLFAIASLSDGTLTRAYTAVLDHSTLAYRTPHETRLNYRHHHAHAA